METKEIKKSLKALKEKRINKVFLPDEKGRLFRFQLNPEMDGMAFVSYGNQIQGCLELTLDAVDSFLGIIPK